MSKKIPNWKLVKDIVREIAPKNNDIVTVQQLKNEYKERHPEPGRNSHNVKDEVNMLTVNSRSRLSHLRIFGAPNRNGSPKSKNSPNEYPRISSLDNEKDILFCLNVDSPRNEEKKYTPYDPKQHGIWEIVLGPDEVNHLVRISEPHQSEIRENISDNQDARPEAYIPTCEDLRSIIRKRSRDGNRVSIKTILDWYESDTKQDLQPGWREIVLNRCSF